MFKYSHTNRREIITQLAKFTVVGAFGTIVHYTILILLVEKIGAGAVVSSSVGAIAGAFVNYFLNYYFTFRSNAPTCRGDHSVLYCGRNRISVECPVHVDVRRLFEVFITFWRNWLLPE